MKLRPPAAFAALQHPNFRLYFWAQAVSLIGSFVTLAAEGWLITALAQGDAKVADKNLSILYALATLPALFGALYSGSLADKKSPRTILIGVVAVQAFLLLFEAALIATGKIQLWHVFVITFFAGATTVFEVPAFAALFPYLLPKSEFGNAIALNSAITQAARMLGPAVAGILIKTTGGTQEMTGLAWCCLIDGLSYLPVLLAFLMLKVTIPVAEDMEDSSVWAHTRAALAYLKTNRPLLALTVLSAVYPLFMAAYVNLLASYLRFERGLGSELYGSLISFQGAGALAASLLAAQFGGLLKRGVSLVLFSVLHYGLVAAFAFSASYGVLAVVLLLSAATGQLAGTTRLALQQLLTPDAYRGRVAGMNNLLYLGLVPLGSFWSGWLATAERTSMGIWGGAVGALIVVVIVFLLVPTLLTLRVQTEESLRLKESSRTE